MFLWRSVAGPDSGSGRAQRSPLPLFAPRLSMAGLADCAGVRAPGPNHPASPVDFVDGLRRDGALRRHKCSADLFVFIANNITLAPHHTCIARRFVSYSFVWG